MQPGSSGRDVDVRRRQEAVGVTDDAKLKSSCATRASPALAHGADEGYSVAKEQTDIAVAAGTEDDSLAASALPTSQVAAAEDRSSVKNSYHGVRSLKHHKNDRSCKSGTGSADLHRASSLQDLNDGGGTGAERSSHALTENKVSCGGLVVTSGMRHVHDTLPPSSDACSANPACTGCGRYADDEDPLSPPRRSRCRTRQPDPQQPELVSYRGIVSNTAQFWEDLVLGSRNSAASRCGPRPRHVSEDGRHFVRRDVSCPRYLTIGSPCEIVPSRTTSDVLSRSESLHVNVELEVCGVA